MLLLHLPTKIAADLALCDQSRREKILSVTLACFRPIFPPMAMYINRQDDVVAVVDRRKVHLLAL